MATHIQFIDMMAQIKQTERDGTLIPFSVETYRYNEQKKEGGQAMFFPQLILYRKYLKLKKIKSEQETTISERDTNNDANLIIRCYDLTQQRIISVKSRFITKFNGLSVVW